MNAPADTPSEFSSDAHLALLGELATKLQCPLDDQRAQRLARYVTLVSTWNKRLDLTAAKGVHAQLEVLLADSFVLARPACVPAASRCVDVGSGAGAPLLPLLMLRDDLSAVAVEPLRKRVAFLRTAVGSLDLVTRTNIVESKLSLSNPSSSGGPFDVALSRATFAPEQWLAVGLQLAPRVLVLLAAQSAPAAPQMAALLDTIEYELPWSHAPRRIAIYERR